MTTTDKRKAKWENMRRLYEAIKEGPITIQNAEEIVSGSQKRIGAKGGEGLKSRRMVELYLQELKAIGLIIYDHEHQKYLLSESKQVYRNKHEYELALSHSRDLILSTESKQGIDATNPLLALDLIVFSDIETWGTDIDSRCIFAHLRTGYLDMFEGIQRYRRLMDETGLSSIPGFPKTIDQLRLPTMISLKDMPDPDSLEKDHRNELDEIDELRDILAENLRSIIERVRSRTPLDGYCDLCPTRRVIIKEFVERTPRKTSNA